MKLKNQGTWGIKNQRRTMVVKELRTMKRVPVVDNIAAADWKEPSFYENLL